MTVQRKPAPIVVEFPDTRITQSFALPQSQRRIGPIANEGSGTGRFVQHRF
jgi:hypothetical protein